MKIPRTVKKYCPNCKTHTEHKVIIVKPSKQRTGLSWGARKAREGKKGKGNHGKYSKRPLSRRKRGVFKLAKGADLRIECTQCGRKHVWNIEGRYRKVEFVSAIKR